jgi:hypothetical protein
MEPTMFDFADMDQAPAVAAAVMEQVFAPATQRSHAQTALSAPVQAASPRGLSRRRLYTEILGSGGPA